MTETRPIESIVIGDRVRKEMGDIKGLAESLQRQGMLHPVVILSDGTLVCGHRRIAAAAMLGWEEVPVTVVNVGDVLSAERDENQVRKDFTPTEAVAVGRLIEEQHKAKIEASQRERVLRAVTIRETKRGNTSGLKQPVCTDANPIGQTRETAARAVGMGGSKYAQAKAVVAAAEADPERYTDLMHEMDSTGNVGGAHRELERRRNGSGRSAVHHKTRLTNHTEDMRRAVWTLQGSVKAMAGVVTTDTDKNQWPEWITALTEARSEILVVMKRLKESA